MMDKFHANVKNTAESISSIANFMGCVIAYFIYAFGLDVALCEYFWGYETYFTIRNVLLCFITAWLLDKFFGSTGLRIMWLIFIITVVYHFVK